jgi:hypothetical protein
MRQGCRANGLRCFVCLSVLYIRRAISFDPANKWTTRGVFAGMAIMALSMVLLSLWDTSA